MTDKKSLKINQKEVRILSLNGGGIKGLFTISVLAEIERILEERDNLTNVKIGDYFDLIAGTSIGGILALGLAEGKSARDLQNVFFQNGKSIFPQKHLFKKTRYFIKRLFNPLYNNHALKKTIIDMIGEEVSFNDLTRRVIIPTINLSSGKPLFFKTPHNPEFTRDKKIKLIDAAMATSAAPTYFPPYFCDDLSAYFVDGGLVANNPSFTALHEVFGDMKKDFPNTSHSDIKILNIGTMGDNFVISPKKFSHKYNQGYFGLWGGGANLVLSTMAANQSLHFNMLNRELYIHDAQDNYVYLDYKVPNEAAKDITLDNSSQSTLDYLASSGKQLATEEFSKNKALKSFFNTTAKPFK